MNNPYVVKCREAVYDEEEEMLVLLCFFEDFGESRIVCFSRSDFHYKYPENPVPHIEMHRTAEAWKGKPFNIVIDDDPNRSRDAEEDSVALGEDFRDRIVNHLGEVSEGLSDLLSDKMVIRSKLKDINF